MGILQWVAKRPFMFVYMLIGLTIYIALLARVESTRHLATRVEQYTVAAGCAPDSTPEQCRQAFSRMLRLMTLQQARILDKTIRKSISSGRRVAHTRRPRHKKAKKHFPIIVHRNPFTSTRKPIVRRITVIKHKGSTKQPVSQSQPAPVKQIREPDSEDPSVDMDQSAETTQPEAPAGLPEFKLPVDPPPVPVVPPVNLPVVPTVPPVELPQPPTAP